VAEADGVARVLEQLVPVRRVVRGVAQERGREAVLLLERHGVLEAVLG